MRKEKSLSEISQTGNNNCPLSPDSQECFRFLEINTNKIISFMDDTCDDKYKSTNYTIQEEFIRSYPWRSYINIQKDPSRFQSYVPIRKKNLHALRSSSGSGISPFLSYGVRIHKTFDGS